METTTTDLSKFGAREMGMAGELLTAYADKPRDFELGEGIQLMMNINSGNVFLTDEDFNVVMMNDKGILENFITCQNCGHEDFASEMKIDESNCQECANA